MRSKETRQFDFEMRAQNSEAHGHHLVGSPIVFGQRTNIGAYDEIIEAGALDNCDMRDVMLLANHDTRMIPFARSRNNNENSTMQFVVGQDKVDMRADLDTENNADARALYSAVERGDISGMSFMFTVDEDKFEDLDTDHPTRRIISISKIFEVSACTWPAYGQTSLEARGLAETLESAAAALESARAEYRKAEEEKRLAKEVEERAAKMRRLKMILELEGI